MRPCVPCQVPDYVWGGCIAMDKNVFHCFGIIAYLAGLTRFVSWYVSPEVSDFLGAM